MNRALIGTAIAAWVLGAVGSTREAAASQLSRTSGAHVPIHTTFPSPASITYFSPFGAEGSSTVLMHFFPFKVRVESLASQKYSPDSRPHQTDTIWWDEIRFQAAKTKEK